jgi:hypothetical protein
VYDGRALEFGLALEALDLRLHLLRFGAQMTVVQTCQHLAGLHAFAFTCLDRHQHTVEPRADLGELTSHDGVARRDALRRVIRPDRDDQTQHPQRRQGDGAAAAVRQRSDPVRNGLEQRRSGGHRRR